MDDSKQKSLEASVSSVEEALKVFAETDQETDDLGVESIRKVLERVSQMKVEIDPDPTVSGGIPVIRKKLSLVEDYLQESLDMLNASRAKLQSKTNRHRSMRIGLKLATDILLSSDPEVRNGRNVTDRQALASIKLQNETIRVQKSQEEMTNAKVVVATLTDKVGQLKDTRKILRAQERDLTELAPVGTVPRFIVSPSKINLPPAGGNFSAKEEGEDFSH